MHEATVKVGQLWVWKLKASDTMRIEIITSVHVLDTDDMSSWNSSQSLVVYSTADNDTGAVVVGLPVTVRAWEDGGFELLSDV